MPPPGQLSEMDLGRIRLSLGELIELKYEASDDDVEPDNMYDVLDGMMRPMRYADLADVV